MTGIKKAIAAVTILVLLAVSQMAIAAAQSAANQNPAVYLNELQDSMQDVAKDMLSKTANFDKAGSTVTETTENVAGIMLRVTVYKDKNGNLLKIYYDPNGNIAQTVTISAGQGPVLTVTYNPNGTVAKEETFLPVGLKKYTEVINSDGTKTVIVQDASLSNNNTLTVQVDQNGNEIPGSAEISTTPGLPEGAVYCQTTGQYQEAQAT